MGAFSLGECLVLGEACKSDSWGRTVRELGEWELAEISAIDYAVPEYGLVCGIADESNPCGVEYHAQGLSGGISPGFHGEFRVEPLSFASNGDFTRRTGCSRGTRTENLRGGRAQQDRIGPQQ